MSAESPLMAGKGRRPFKANPIFEVLKRMMPNIIEPADGKYAGKGGAQQFQMFLRRI